MKGRWNRILHHVIFHRFAIICNSSISPKLQKPEIRRCDRKKKRNYPDHPEKIPWSKAEKKEKREPEVKDDPNEGNKARIFPQDLERWDAQKMVSCGNTFWPTYFYSLDIFGGSHKWVADIIREL